MTERIILGIDPGTNIMGYGVIRQKDEELTLLGMGALKLAGLPDPMVKLEKILQTTLSLIDQYRPDELSIEAPFYGKNIQSMLKLGRAQGVAIAAALLRKLPIFEYSPRKVKQSITGKGGASKEQVAAMLQKFFTVEVSPGQLDATDAIAIALCHYFQRMPSVSKSQYHSWKGFVNENPGRVVQ
ncbi:MAG: crossover junction endodeoxyribonuclease RuvC [Bacteroidetes bacterium]|nr:crossover junction endodeoxyribonuclease RuvC [Bacteroidota bacterium]